MCLLALKVHKFRKRKQKHRAMTFVDLAKFLTTVCTVCTFLLTMLEHVTASNC